MGKRPKLRAKGERGSWFAIVDGERLPCVHQFWIKGTHHNDPNYDDRNPKFLELFEAIRMSKRVVLTKDVAVENAEKNSGIGFQRTGYVAVYRVENVEADQQGLRFDLVERLTE